MAVLGDPIEHSLSPVIHRAALQACGLAGSYEARPVDDKGLRQAVDEIRAGDLYGANVTMPHKRLAAELADRLDPRAARAGSVNTLLSEDGEVAGYSTDIDGLLDAWGDLPEKGPVLVLGAGGAAAAAYVALEHRSLYGAGRRQGAVEELAGRVGVGVGEVRWGVPVVGATLVNATPLGMQGEQLPAAVIELCDGLFDMVYAPRPTPAVVSVRKAGRPAVDGLELLLAQAARSFTLWTGREPPLAAMRAAVENSQAASRNGRIFPEVGPQGARKCH